MKTNKKIASLVIILAVAAVGVLAWTKRHSLENRIQDLNPPPAYNPSTPPVVAADHVLLNVPFFAQAPTGNWADPREEDGCEEASLQMAWLWINNTTTTPALAEKTIQDMSDFELAHYGNYNDLDAQDTAKLMADYYHYTKTQVKENISIDDIKNELRKGNLILVPANGQKLGNPNFKSPGPLTHMLVIRGFDDASQKFITNDPGTHNGNEYKYNYSVLYNAMVNYPSGHHEDQTGRPKAMIIVEK